MREPATTQTITPATATKLDSREEHFRIPSGINSCEYSSGIFPRSQPQGVLGWYSTFTARLFLPRFRSRIASTAGRGATTWPPRAIMCGASISWATERPTAFARWNGGRSESATRPRPRGKTSDRAGSAVHIGSSSRGTNLNNRALLGHDSHGPVCCPASRPG